MPTGKYIDPNKIPKTTADKWTLFVGFAGATKILLAAPPINIEIEQETVDAWVNVLGYIFIGIAMYRNNRRHK